VVLYLLALAAGGVAGWIAVKKRTVVPAPEEHFVVPAPTAPPRAREISAAAGALGVLVSGAVAWLTVSGLRWGFL
jgi:hypothetical protein